MVGGGELKIKFPIKAFLNLESRENGSDDSLVSMSVDPSSIRFEGNRSTSSWVPISTIRDLHVTQGAVIRWDANQILIRFRLRANIKQDGRSVPSLLLEAIILPTGTWEAMPEPKRLLLSSTASAAIPLWSQECKWYSPLPDKKLPTPAGIYRPSLDFKLPSELEYRWSIQVVLMRSCQGLSVSSKEEFTTYLDNPYKSNNITDWTFWLPNPLVPNNESGDAGRSTHSYQSCFARKGRVIKRQRVTAPAPAKFNTIQKGFPLSGSALPPDTPSHLKEVARKLFNASIASSTARTYSTTASHLTRLERTLGRSLTWPLSPQDYNLVVTYLADRGVKSSTVKQYLAGARRIALSKGVENPSPQSDLAKTLLKGYENLKRDPISAVASATHRPVTIPFLRLLGHATSKHWEGDTGDKLCFWTVCLISFWGSLRIGEVLCEKPQNFAPASDLLGSDVICMSPTSIALWLRDPKVPKEFGDVVEIWSTPQFPDINPFTSFSAFWKQRNKLFKPTQPLFMRVDGKNFTHRSFGNTLQALLSHYSLQLELGANRWTGHSFRSGLPTLLQSAGFKDEEIKAWGRWASASFQLYTRDISKRMEVQRTIVDAMDRLKTVSVAQQP